MEYINFNDESLPIGKRKQAYIKFVVSKGTDIISAKRQANKKFGEMKTTKEILILLKITFKKTKLKLIIRHAYWKLTGEKM